MKQPFKITFIFESRVGHLLCAKLSVARCRKQRDELFKASSGFSFPFHLDTAVLVQIHPDNFLLSVFPHWDIFHTPAKPVCQYPLNSFGRLALFPEQNPNSERTRRLPFTPSVATLSFLLFLVIPIPSHFRASGIPSGCIACLSIST